MQYCFLQSQSRPRESYFLPPSKHTEKSERQLTKAVLSSSCLQLLHRFLDKLQALPMNLHRAPSETLLGATPLIVLKIGMQRLCITELAKFTPEASNLVLLSACSAVFISSCGLEGNCSNNKVKGRQPSNELQSFIHRSTKVSTSYT